MRILRLMYYNMGICCIPKKRKYRKFDEREFLHTKWSDPLDDRHKNANKAINKGRNLSNPRKKDSEIKKKTEDLIDDLTESKSHHIGITHDRGHSHHHAHHHHHNQHHHDNKIHFPSGIHHSESHSHHIETSAFHHTSAEIDIGTNLE